MTIEERAKQLEDMFEKFALYAPYQLVGFRLPDYAFADSHVPGDNVSFDDPPIRIDKNSEIFPIDNVLGRYDPEKQEITVFNKGIDEACGLLGIDKENLVCIVRLHEWAHAFVHIGLTKEQRKQLSKDENLWTHILSDSTDLFNNIEFGLHELLAQLLTYHSLQDTYGKARSEHSKNTIGKIIEAFDQLSLHQPSEYRIGDLRNAPKDRVIKSIDLIKRRWLVGKIEPWRIVVEW